MFEIVARDVEYARERWEGDEREYVEAFSSGRVTLEILTRLAKSTTGGGGFAITRRFQGGLKLWSKWLINFNRHVAEEVQRYLRNPDSQIIFSLHECLAEQCPMNSTKRPSVLGISAASKLLFFMCPKLPFFIYDSDARLALNMRVLEPHEYRTWWNRCRDILAEVNLPLDTRIPDGANEDWFHRRCFDKMLIEKGRDKKRHISDRAFQRRERLMQFRI